MLGFKIVSKDFEDDLRREIRIDMNEEIERKVENRIKNMKEDQEKQKEIDGYKEKYKIGTTFKYLDLKVILKSFRFRGSKITAIGNYLEGNNLRELEIQINMLENIIKRKR